MVDHPRCPRALRALGCLVTVAATLIGLAPGPAAYAATPGPPVRAAAAEAARAADAEETPLQVTIEELTPGYLPRTGRIEVTGTVTNRDDEAWTTINLYAIDGSSVAPMQTPAEVAAALEVPEDAYVGDRITEEGESDTVDLLEPGETASFSISVPASAIDAIQGGVYWFGVHASGASASSPRDDFTDGRARTLLPYIPPRINASLPTSLVLPLTRPVPYAADGSLDELPRWQRSLSPGGRLHDLVAFAEADPAELTWMVDPALLDAVARLARGNPGRSLEPTTPSGPSGSPSNPATEAGDATAAGGDGAGGADDGQDAGGEGDGGSGAPTPGELEGADRTTREVAMLAADWLRRTRAVLEAGQVMVLPYGNLDVTAALDEAPALLDLARAQQSQVLRSWQVTTTPVTTGPQGYLDAAAVADAEDGTVLLGDEAVTSRRPPTLASLEGREVVVASSGPAQGGPGPGPALSAINLRQRVLAEAAVRVITRDKQPLVSVLPTQWRLDEAEAFFDGLGDAPWVDLDRLDGLVSAASPTSLDPEELDYPQNQADRELDAVTLGGVSELITSGEMLQNLLTDNNQVAGIVAGEALTRASYAARNSEPAARLETGLARAWIEDRLGAVSVSAPPGVTLSSESGGFTATLTNDLDQPVTVSLAARSDGGIVVDQPQQIRIAAQSRTTLLLDAEASSSTLHRVELVVTDAEGNLLGSTYELPIRYAQVSEVIWLIMGTGAAILFAAIALRLVRRVRRGRAEAGDPQPADAEPAPVP